MHTRMNKVSVEKVLDNQETIGASTILSLRGWNNFHRSSMLHSRRQWNRANCDQYFDEHVLRQGELRGLAVYEVIGSKF